MARMKHAHPSPISQDSLEAFIASALLGLMWLMGVILKLAAPHRSRTASARARHEGMMVQTGGNRASSSDRNELEL